MSRFDYQRELRKTELFKQMQAQFPILNDNDGFQYNIIDHLVLYKMVYYYRYLLMKTQLHQITHKKIVQIIFNKYTPTPKLQISSPKCIGKNQHYFLYFKDSMKHIPKTLQKLVLNFDSAWLGKHKDHYINIGQALQELPNLCYFKLEQKYNSIGKDLEYFHYLLESIKQLPQLEFLHIDMERNFMTDPPDMNLKIFGENLKNLKNLRHFRLNLNDNELGKKECYLDQLGQSFLQLKSLEKLYLNLGRNQLVKDNKNRVKEFKEKYLDKLPNLKSLELWPEIKQ